MSAASLESAEQADWPANYGPASAWWAVIVMMVFNIVSLIDRQVVSLLIPEMRGRFGALAVLASNLFGFAFGPMLVGAITDYGFRDPNMIGCSIAITVAAAGPCAAWLIWSARRDFLNAVGA